MKKLIIAIVAGAVGLAVQAASVNWNTGALYLPQADGTWSTTKATDTTAGTWNIVVSFFDADKNAFAAGGTLSDNTITALNSSLNGSATGFENGKKYYMSGILTYEDGSNMYTYEFDKVGFTTRATGATAANMQNTTTFESQIINTSSPQGWTITPVPEPTSGLLLLLGMAGLTLKRKRV